MLDHYERTGEIIECVEFALVLTAIETRDSAIAAIEDATHESGRAELLLKSQLELLAEHRQALITAAVTGEFVVPGTASL